jgi:hypothetical protein
MQNKDKIQELLNLIKNWETHKIPKEFLTEEIFTTEVDSLKNTLLHRCAYFSYEKSFLNLPENLKQEKYLLLKNDMDATVLHILIEQDNAEEIAQELIFKNIENLDLNGNNLLHKLGLSKNVTPPEWFKHPGVNYKNMYLDTPLHLFAAYQAHNIPPCVTRDQLLTTNLAKQSALNLILKTNKLEVLNKKLLTKLKLDDLYQNNNTNPQNYNNEQLKKLYTEAISYTVKKQLTQKKKLKLTTQKNERNCHQFP